MNKLTYTKIADSVIEIDLHNDYIVIAMYLHNKENNTYIVNFYIREVNTDVLDMMSDLTIEFKVDHTRIKPTILKHVATLLSGGCFEKYIKRYDDYILYSESRVC